MNRQHILRIWCRLPQTRLTKPRGGEEVASAENETSVESKIRLRDLGGLLLKYGKKHMPSVPARSAPVGTEPPRMVGTHAHMLRYLRWIPIALTALFLLSFIWDFPGATLSLFGTIFTLDGLLRIIAVSGLIGFLTNWLALTMLFQPRQRRPIFGQGLVPSQRDRVIFRLAQGVSEELINEDIIKQKIQESGAIRKYRELGLEVLHGVLEDSDFRNELKNMVSVYAQQVLGSAEVRERLARVTMEKIEEYAGNGLSRLALQTYRFFREDEFRSRVEEAIEDLPNALDSFLDDTDHWLDLLPEKIEAHADDVERWVTLTVLGFVERLDIYNMIRTNMAQFDDSRLEQLIKRSTNEQLNYIKYLGGILGMLGGLVIWEPVLAISVFSILGLSLYAIDEFLLRSRQPAPPSTQQPVSLPETSDKKQE